MISIKCNNSGSPVPPRAKNFNENKKVIGGGGPKGSKWGRQADFLFEFEGALG